MWFCYFYFYFNSFPSTRALTPRLFTHMSILPTHIYLFTCSLNVTHIYSNVTAYILLLFTFFNCQFHDFMICLSLFNDANSFLGFIVSEIPECLSQRSPSSGSPSLLSPPSSLLSPPSSLLPPRSSFFLPLPTLEWKSAAGKLENQCCIVCIPPGWYIFKQNVFILLL